MKTLFEIIKAGIIATAIMTAMMLGAPMMGMPEMPIGNMLADFMGMPVAMGWVAHFMIGISIAAGYILFFSKKFMSVGPFSGIIYSIIPFLAAQLMVMPMMGAGVFSSNTPTPMMMVMGSLVGHVVYGLILGAISKRCIIKEILSDKNSSNLAVKQG